MEYSLQHVHNKVLHIVLVRHYVASNNKKSVIQTSFNEFKMNLVYNTSNISKSFEVCLQ